MYRLLYLHVSCISSKIDNYEIVVIWHNAPVSSCMFLYHCQVVLCIGALLADTIEVLDVRIMIYMFWINAYYVVFSEI